MYNDNVFIERIMLEVGREFGTRFEFECYDIGHLYTLAHFAERKLVEPPFLIQGVFGILGGIGADVRNLAHMVTIADSLFGDDYLFSAFAAGRHQLRVLHPVGAARRQCARRARGQPVHRQGRAGDSRMPSR